MGDIEFRADEDTLYADGDIKQTWDLRDNDETTTVALSDGTVFTLDWDSDDDIWRIKKVFSGAASYSHLEGDHSETYSDRVTISGYVKWIVVSQGDPIGTLNK